MRTKKLLLLAVMLLGVTAIFAAINLCNLHTPKLLAQGGKLELKGADVLEKIYMLAGEWDIEQEPMGTRYRLSLDMDGREGLYLYFHISWDCRLFINGQEIQPVDDIYRPFFLYDLTRVQGNAPVEIAVLISQTERLPAARNWLFISSMEKALTAAQANRLFRLFFVGIAFCAFLYSISLYFSKHTEKYLLVFAVLSYVHFGRCLAVALPEVENILIFKILLLSPWNFSSGIPLQLNYLQRYAIQLLTSFLTHLIYREFLDVRIGKQGYLQWLGLPACLVLLLLPAVKEKDFFLLTYCIYLIEYGLECYVILRAFSAKNQWTICILSCAWVLTAAFRLTDMLFKYNLIPYGQAYLYLDTQSPIIIFKLIGFMLVINDKYAKAFGQSETLSQELESIVAQRTFQLQESYNKLQKASKLRAAFMSGVVHNLKTPMFSQYGYLEMAKNELRQAPEEAEKYLCSAMRNANYMMDMVEKLFLSVRLDDGQVNYHMAPFEAADLANYLLETVLPDRQAKEIEIKSSIQAGMPICFGDANYIRQALLNILDNAIRHTDRGGCIQLNIFVRDECLCCQIFDNGEGIEAAALPHIFDAYFSSRKGGRRSGLGLTIAKSIIVKHGGDIFVESQLGRGSNFTIKLPIKPPDDGAESN